VPVLINQNQQQSKPPKGKLSVLPVNVFTKEGSRKSFQVFFSQLLDSMKADYAVGECSTCE